MNPRPTHRAVIDIGHKCSASCIHCYHTHEKASWSFRPLDDLKREADTALYRGNNYVDFTGGEPTLHPDIVELVKYVNSIDLKCCIITNALAGKTRVEELLNAGVDDWLISAHGTDIIHNDIVKVEQARRLQVDFINRLISFGQDFRFNFCMMKHNQGDIVATAKWMTQWKPRIVNFIQFNPHGAWQSDIEGTKSNLGDLNILEAQLSEAIPILLNDGIGVNVRYYPMCRIPETFRSHICNDLQVMHDPFEWDYDTTPKTFKKYMEKANSFSVSNEWKAQPCMACDLRGICGGINSAFFRATDDKKCIHAVKDDSVIRTDPFFYRRHNTVCLTECVPSVKKMCIAAIADENMAAYVPPFLYCASKNYPDYDIRVFATYNPKSPARAISDRYVGNGIYDECVVDVHAEMAHYGTNPNATRAIRFVEFESYLKDYENVLWTDIDILFQPDGDIVKFHSDIMNADGTVCFENYITQHIGRLRLCGVHFITKGWWKAVSGSLEAARNRIKNNPCPDWDFDETNLMQLVQESGLKIPPVKHSDIKRHHGVHIGDFVAEAKGKGPAPMTSQISGWISSLLSDARFVSLLDCCRGESENLRIFYDKISTINSRSKPQLSAAPAKTNLPKRTNPFTHYDGSFIIFTVVDELYQWYIPIFARSIELAYPGQKSFVLVRGNIDPSISSALKSFKNSCAVDTDSTELIGGGWTTAAYRFVVSNPEVEKFDFALITDIDIVFMPETVPIVDQHMRNLKAESLTCYDNMVSQRRGEEVRLPGVHFVTKEWWGRTAEARGIEKAILCSTGATEYCHDEFMLGRIVKNSGLNISSKVSLQWQHGVHIGDWRISIERKGKVFQNVWQKMHISTLLKDEIFMSLLNSAAEKITWLKKLEKEWRFQID